MWVCVCVYVGCAMHLTTPKVYVCTNLLSLSCFGVVVAGDEVAGVGVGFDVGIGRGVADGVRVGGGGVGDGIGAVVGVLVSVVVGVRAGVGVGVGAGVGVCVSCCGCSCVGVSEVFGMGGLIGVRAGVRYAAGSMTARKSGSACRSIPSVMCRIRHTTSRSLQNSPRLTLQARTVLMPNLASSFRRGCQNSSFGLGVTRISTASHSLPSMANPYSSNRLSLGRRP